MGRFTYAEYAVGGAQNRNRVMRIDEFQLDGSRSECYRSLFLFDDGLKAWVDRTGSVSGYADKHLADEMVFDFDGKDLEAVRKEVANFCHYLEAAMDVPQEYVRIAFSGFKGFHVSIPMKAFGETEASAKYHKVYRGVARDMLGDFKRADMSIYELHRLMRLLNTVNTKSGLYKISLTWDEVQKLPIDQIKELALAERRIEQLSADEMGVVPSLRDLWHQHEGLPLVNPVPETGVDAGSILTKMRGVPQGMRNNAAISLVGTFIDKGLDAGLTLGILQLWNGRNTPPLGDGELTALVQGAYRQYGRPKGELRVYSLADAEDKYREYVSNLDKARVLIGYPMVDRNLRGIMPGETCCILGKTSAGKSAFLQNIGLNYARQAGKPVLFFSLEMPLTSVFERTIQIETGLSGGEVEAAYRIGNKVDLDRFSSAITTLPNFYTVEKSGLSLNDIRSLIRFAEENIFHEKTGLVMIDYLGLVKGEGDGIYEQVSTVARGMKDLAKECGVPLIFLSQVNRKYDDYEELGIGAARDSGAVDEASDFILGLYRDCGPQDGPVKPLVLNIIKNRRGGIGKTPILMDKKSIRITEGATIQRACSLKPARAHAAPVAEAE